MRRREFLHAVAASTVALALPGRVGAAGTSRAKAGQVMTVTGAIDARDLGMTLTHEHLFADLRPFDEQATAPLPPDVEQVVEVVLPYLQAIRRMGCRSLVDCTATTLGRNPALIRRLSEASDLYMLTVTGAYLAAGGRFIPPYVRDETDEQLAARWIAEWRDGIDGTGVRPGLIKLGVEGDPLTDLERKALRAAARTHRASGLAIAVHTGPWGDVAPGRNARCALAQLEALEAAGVEASAWIWVHAQNEKQGSQHVLAARRGGWVSFDGYRPGQEDAYLAMIDRMRKANLLDRVLVSQDAGWYNAGQPRGGKIEPYAPLFTTLLPALRRHGLGEHEIRTLFTGNPARALALRARAPS